MKSSRGSSLLKQVFSAIVAAVRAKSMAVKHKATAMKTRLIIFWLLRNKSFIMSSISSKIHSLMSRERPCDGDDGNGALISVAAAKSAEMPELTNLQQEVISMEAYPEPEFTSAEMEDEEGKEQEQEESIVELDAINPGNSIDEDLQNEIDHMADAFIKRFHKQIRMEKLESFKRYQEMLERSS